MALSNIIKQPISIKVEKCNWLKSENDLKKRLREIVDEEVNNDIMIRFDYELKTDRENPNTNGKVTYANPVYMAIVMKEYELARALLDKGYDAVSDKKQWLSSMKDKNIEEVEPGFANEIRLSQLILIDESIPDDILKRILDELYEKRKTVYKILDFTKDVVWNPYINYLCKGNNHTKEVKIMIDSVEKIKNIDKKYISGMLNTSHECFLYDESPEDKMYICEKLLSIFDKEEEILNVIKEVINSLFIEVDKYSEEDGCRKKDYLISDFWLQLVPKIRSVCQQNESIGKHVAILYFKKFKDLSKTRKNKLSKRFILPICKDIAFDEKMVKYLYMENVSDVFGYITSWKETFGVRIVWKRYNENYINLMVSEICNLPAYKLESSKKILRFLACIDELDKEREILNELSYVKENNMIKHILALNNEEIIMVMLEIGYYSDEFLDVLIARCMDNQYVSLVPMLIYYREKEREDRACIQ